jgi:hypothetical protein
MFSGSWTAAARGDATLLPRGDVRAPRSAFGEYTTSGLYARGVNGRRKQQLRENTAESATLQQPWQSPTSSVSVACLLEALVKRRSLHYNVVVCIG